MLQTGTPVDAWHDADFTPPSRFEPYLILGRYKTSNTMLRMKTCQDSPAQDFDSLVRQTFYPGNSIRTHTPPYKKR